MNFIALFLLAITVVPLASRNAAAQQPFTIAISTSTPTVNAGAPVSIMVELTNTSDHDLDTSGSIMDFSGLDSNFTFKIRDSADKIAGKKTHKHQEETWSGKAILGRILKPGETLKEEQIVSRSYDLSEPGKYLIQVLRCVSDSEGDPCAHSGVVKSNKLTVTVVSK